MAMTQRAAENPSATTRPSGHDPLAGVLEAIRTAPFTTPWTRLLDRIARELRALDAHQRDRAFLATTKGGDYQPTLKRDSRFGAAGRFLRDSRLASLVRVSNDSVVVEYRKTG